MVFIRILRKYGLSFDFVAPIYAGGGYIGGGTWGRNDIYYTILRLRDGVDREEINRQIYKAMQNIILILLMMNGEIFMMHSHCPKFIWMTQIPALAFTFMVFGLCHIFVAIMNYVLVAIATMSRRAKSIGVHKCSGASAINIFSMFLFETGIVVLMSVIVALFIIFNTKDLIEDLLSVQLSSLFTLETLWVPMLIVLYCS